jgi:phage tail tape-measure protein
LKFTDDEILIALSTALAVLALVSIYLFNALRKTRNQLETQEQAIAHLAIALETLNSGSEPSEVGDNARSTSAIIGGIAGGGLGAIWGPVGVIAGSGIGSGIGNLAPDALEKAKEVVGKLQGNSKDGSKSKKKGFFGRIPFIGKRRGK